MWRSSKSERVQLKHVGLFLKFMKLCVNNDMLANSDNMNKYMGISYSASHETINKTLGVYVSTLKSYHNVLMLFKDIENGVSIKDDYNYKYLCNRILRTSIGHLSKHGYHVIKNKHMLLAYLSTKIVFDDNYNPDNDPGGVIYLKRVTDILNVINTEYRIIIENNNYGVSVEDKGKYYYFSNIYYFGIKNKQFIGIEP